MRVVRNAGLNIKLRLEKLGIEQKVLAELWGVTPAAVSNLLSGKRKLEADKLFSAADFLGCSVYDLIKPGSDSLTEAGCLEEGGGFE